MGCDLAPKVKAARPARVPATKPTPPPKATPASGPTQAAGGNAVAALPDAQPPLPNDARDRNVAAARAARAQFESWDVEPLFIEQRRATAPACPGLHACHDVPGPRMPFVVDVINLEGQSWFPLKPSTIDLIWKQTWEPQTVPVRWGSIAKGHLTLEKDIDGALYSIGGLQQLAFSHPALPARAGLAPALAIRVEQGFITGGLSQTSTVPTMGPSPQTVTLVDDRQASTLAELDDLQDLSVGTFTNEVRGGRFAFVLDDLEYLLDGVLPGKGSFDLGRQKPLVAAATIEAVCVAKQDIELQRDLDGRISAEKQLSLALKPPEADASWSGGLVARFSRGTYDIRGTADYTSAAGDIRGSVTVILTDKCSAWAAVRQRLGSAAPAGPVADESAMTMALVGWGELDFNISKWLKGSAEVVVDPDGYITTRGTLAPSATYELFGQKQIPASVLPGTKISIPRINLVGDFISVDGYFSFDAQGWYGPATLHDITAVGVYSTNPHIPTELDIGATLTVSAQAALQLEVGGHIRAGLGPVGGVGLKISLGGKATLSGYAEAQPHIARRRVDGARDGSTEYVIAGSLEVAAALDCALSGEIDLTSDLLGFHKDWTLVKLEGRTWRVTDFGVHLNFEHVIGKGRLPRVWLGNAQGDVGFNDFKFMKNAVRGSTDSGPARQEREQDAFTARPVAGALPAAHEPTTGAPETSVPPATQAAGPLEPAADQPMPPRAQTPATGDVLPTASAPPHEHADVDMEGVHHDLTLVFDDPPAVYLASPSDDQLSRKLGVAVKAISDEIDVLTKGGTNPDRRTIEDLEQERATLREIMEECIRVELAAARLGIHPARGLPSHVPGFAELAERLHGYARQFARTDLLSTPGAKAAPAIPVRARPAQLRPGGTPNLDDLEKAEPGVTQRYVTEYQAYVENGGDQDLIRYIEGRAARKLGRLIEPPMIEKFEQRYGKSSQKLTFTVLDPDNPDPAKRVRPRVPDIYSTDFAVGDVKDVQYQSYELQLQDDIAISYGGPSVQRGGASEPAHDPVLKMFVIVRRASHLRPRTELSERLKAEVARTKGSVLYWIPDPMEK